MNLPLKTARPLLARTLVTITMLATSIVVLTGCSIAPPHPIVAKIEADMILVEGGSFIMGSNSQHANASEQPAHEVTVDDFYISKFEVTQSLFEQVMGPSRSFFKDPQIPVNNLSWQQAYFFIERLNELTGQHYRLPTEAEWEFAANGGNQSQGYAYSGSNNIDDVAWFSGNANNQAHRVGQKKPNELGLYDMTGNVGEFTIDAFESTFYRNSPTHNPSNEQHTDIKLAHKSVRGGSFAYAQDESENFRRDFASQTIIMSDMGLRLVRDAR